MEKVFKKHETLFTILLIVIYVVVNFYLMQIVSLKRVKYYGLNKSKIRKKPLCIILLFNLRNGIYINDTFKILKLLL